MRHAACLLAYKQQHRRSPFWFVLFTTGRRRLKNMAAVNVQYIRLLFCLSPQAFHWKEFRESCGYALFLIQNQCFDVSHGRFLSLHVRQKRPKKPLKVRSVAAPVEQVAGFDDMV
ncbi:hypothetical protein SLA2020_051050 [Shorea laevis]